MGLSAGVIATVCDDVHSLGVALHQVHTYQVHTAESLWHSTVNARQAHLSMYLGPSKLPLLCLPTKGCVALEQLCCVHHRLAADRWGPPVSVAITRPPTGFAVLLAGASCRHLR